jgi:catechol 2,3-dioxygenase-like lactoylglutathione lyase family enzyme
MPLTLDHLVIAVRDLDSATDAYAKLLGLAPSWYGSHPAYGTANVLFRLPETYIELLAPAAERTGVGLQPDVKSPWLQALRQRLDTAGEGLYAIALGTNDIDATVASAREHGLSVSDPARGDGVDQITGARREWRNARIDPESTRQILAFFIQHDSSPGALPLAQATDAQASVTGIDHVVLASSDLTDCARLWHETLGLDLRATVDRPEGRRLQFLRLGGSILELAGETAPAQPGARDLLWGIAYRVDDLARTVQRLRAGGVDVSDARAGNAPGTLVADLKPGISHDVRTLFIQKDPPA